MKSFLRVIAILLGLSAAALGVLALGELSEKSGIYDEFPVRSGITMPAPELYL